MLTNKDVHLPNAVLKNTGLVLFTMLLAGIYYRLQPTVQYGLEPLMDGNQYCNIYHYFKGNHELYLAKFPFHSRIGIPFLASLLPFDDMMLNFQLVNVCLALLSVVAISMAWDTLQLSRSSQVIGLFWLLFHWTGLVRLNIMDPLTVDVPLYLFEALFVWSFFKHKKMLMALIPVAGLFFKESFLVLPLILLAWLLIYNWLNTGGNFRNKLSNICQNDLLYYGIGSFAACIVVKLMLDWQFPPYQGESFNAITTVLFFAKKTLLNPERLLHWFVAVYFALGIIGVLGLYSIHQWKHHREKMFLVTGTMAFLGLGLLAGGDMTRIIFLGFPFFATLGLVNMQQWPALLKGMAMILSILFMRLLCTIPLIHENRNAFDNWFPEFMAVQPLILWLCYGFFSLLVMILMIRLRVKGAGE